MTRRIWVMMSAIFLIAAATITNAETVKIPEGTTLIVLRHADRFEDNLNKRGIARAAALVPALEGIAIDRIYSPGLQRNLDTVAPLAKQRDITVIRHPTSGVAKGVVAANPGRTILWVGNKTNLRNLWKDIAAQDPPPLEYGDLFIVTRGAQGQPVIDRRFVDLPDGT